VGTINRNSERAFRIKIAPAASYAIGLVWQALKKKQFGELDRLKAAFLKRALGVHGTSRNRLVYLLAGEDLFTEELVKLHRLERTTEHK